MEKASEELVLRASTGRGVYAALIVGTPPISFAESFSIRQFLFFIYLFIT